MDGGDGMDYAALAKRVSRLHCSHLKQMYMLADTFAVQGEAGVLLCLHQQGDSEGPHRAVPRQRRPPPRLCVAHRTGRVVRRGAAAPDERGPRPHSAKPGRGGREGARAAHGALPRFHRRFDLKIEWHRKRPKIFTHSFYWKIS